MSKLNYSLVERIEHAFKNVVSNYEERGALLQGVPGDNNWLFYQDQHVFFPDCGSNKIQDSLLATAIAKIESENINEAIADIKEDISVITGERWDKAAFCLHPKRVASGSRFLSLYGMYHHNARGELRQRIAHVSVDSNNAFVTVMDMVNDKPCRTDEYSMNAYSHYEDVVKMLMEVLFSFDRWATSHLT